jgi:hypothetical protein
MVTKTLDLTLGTIPDPPAYATGWYRDPNTGQYYYYDASLKQWCIYAAGVLTPLSIASETAPKTVSITPGDTLRIQYSYQYSGPAISVTEYASIGVYGEVTHVYDEKVHQSKSHSLPESSAPATYTGTLDIVLPAAAQTDWDDIECKVSDGGKELGLRYIGALSIVAITPEFSEFTIVDYSKV